MSVLPGPRSASRQLWSSISTPRICRCIRHPAPDELSLLSFKITQRKKAAARTHPPAAGSQSARSSCLASFALRQPQLPRELVRRNLCLCPSFPNLWAHTPAQPLLLRPWQHPCPHPHPLQHPETSVCCCEANEQESWGNFRVKF